MCRNKLLLIFLLLPLSVGAFELNYHRDESGQRRDGSKLFDIVYELTELDPTDTIQIFIYAITQSGETLAFSTPDTTWGTFSGDTVRVIGSGIYHIVWNIGIDQPNREFYSDSIVIQVGAGIPGWRPGPCETIIAIAAGATHTVALKSDGTVWTWGYNTYGQLGDGTTTHRHTPVQVVGPGGSGFLTDVIAIAGGMDHTIALKSDGTVWTWGDNAAGQLGDGTHTGRTAPVQVVGPGGSGFLTDVIAIAGGYWHTIALKSDGTVWTWGYNIAGQLGDGTYTERHTPVQVVGPGGSGFLTDIITIAGGSSHTIALKSDGTVWTWGWNGLGQLGDGTTSSYRTTPVQVVGPGGIGFLTDVVAIAGGGHHTIALKSDGTVWAWGDNYYGQLGDGNSGGVDSLYDPGIDSNTPVQVLGPGGSGFLTDVIAVATRNCHTVALKSDGTVWAWGPNGYGRLGDGTTTDRNTPVLVVGPGGTGYLTDVIAIAAGGGHTVVLKSDGTVWTWGWNGLGQLGDGTTTDSPTPVRALLPW